MKHRFIIFVLLLTYYVNAQDEQVNLFITENSADFEILNRYQQKISDLEKIEFKPFLPWIIIEKEVLLSDQFTKAMHVQHDKRSYFFVLSGEGDLIHKNKEIYYQVIEDCTPIDDEVEVVSDSSVLYRDVPFSLNSQDFPIKYLFKNSRLKRYYKKGPSFLVQNVANNTYGWIRISSSKAVIRIIKDDATLTTTSFSEKFHKDVTEKVEKINRLYSQLFQYLNREYLQDRSAPSWQISSSEDMITLTLVNCNPEKMKKSTAYLVNDLERMITEYSYDVSQRNGNIIISLN